MYVGQVQMYVGQVQMCVGSAYVWGSADVWKECRCVCGGVKICGGSADVF